MSKPHESSAKSSHAHPGSLALLPARAQANTPFASRAQAGRMLADELFTHRLEPPLLVLALPRGGVPVAAEIAHALGAPLDLLLVRKIGAPFQPELAVAAVVEGTPPEVVINKETAGLPGVSEAYIRSALPDATREIARRRSVYMAGRPQQPMESVTVIVVDDGMATGTTMKAALQALRRRRPARLIAAVPVAPRDTIADLRHLVDEVICLRSPEPFHAIGLHYLDFHQLGDDEVCALLDAAHAAHRPR